ncbi:MAG: helix-turn-helix domain-containing protein [Candidatus Lokiarchaeota archaeon]|nr:helix-turn-helix domain-containing protein [Candidatus Lokiarchaeota archaeon]
MPVENIIKSIDDLLKKAHYETFSVFDKNKFCFDLLVKKENSILLIKVFSNIDNLNEHVINGIKSMSNLLKSKPILIGIKNRYQKLEDNTIYIREDLPFITFNTLKNIIFNEEYPYILARRGGGIVFLDGAVMKEIREEKSISRKELSEKLDITKRTICSYENENMRPSQTIAEKILDILEDKTRRMFKNINIFEWSVKFNIDRNKIGDEQELNPFESHLQDIISDIGISSYWYKKDKVPFELSIHSKHLYPDSTEEKLFPIFSKVPEENKKINDLKFNYFLFIFTHLFDRKGIFIVNNDFKLSAAFKNKLTKTIPILKIKNLEEIDSESEFIDLIKKNDN